MKYFYCSHCGKQLINQRVFVECENENEFWCDDCGTTYIVDDDGYVLEESSDQ